MIEITSAISSVSASQTSSLATSVYPQMPPSATLRLLPLRIRPRVLISAAHRPAASFVVTSSRHASSSSGNSSSGSGNDNAAATAATAAADAALNPNPEVKPRTHPSPDVQSNIEPKGPNMDQLPHITEETAAMSKSVGEAGPDIDQGTPIGEAARNSDKKTQDSLPKVMRDALNKSSQKRSLHTSARRLHPPDLAPSSASTLPVDALPTEILSNEAVERAAARTLAQLQDPRYAIDAETARMVADGQLPDPHEARLDRELVERPGLKFAYPEGLIERLPRERNRRRKEGPTQDMDCVTQVTNLIMQHGKKSVAQKNMSLILSHLRTSPAPQLAYARVPLLPDPVTGKPYTPASLALDPETYLTLAVDSVAPLMRLRSIKGLTGGGALTQIPKPLGLRQRRRAAVGWILDAAAKGKGGLQPFHRRFADEVVKVVEGRSAAWERRGGLHKVATTSRSNLNMVARGGMKR